MNFLTLSTTMCRTMKPDGQRYPTAMTVDQVINKGVR